MRFIHTADLHLGKQFNDVSLLDDQEYILGQITDIAKRKKADALIVAGDIYQRSSPQADAMVLFDRFVSKLSAEGIKVIAISGNHDSADRISYLSGLVRDSGVYMSETYNGTVQSIALRDEYGEVTVWMLPYLRPAQVKKALPGEKITSFQSAMEAVIRSMGLDERKRNVLICHQFITGGELSESEDIYAGGLESIDASVFDSFDYVALGHLHRPQHITRETLRYAGSPLKYSFSEAPFGKSVTVVDMEEKGEVKISTEKLIPLREVRTVGGSLKELREMPPTEDYVWVTVTDELVPPDARYDLVFQFPNMLRYSVKNAKTKEDIDLSFAKEPEKTDVRELFREFYRFQNNGVDPGEAHMDLLDDILEKLGGEGE